MHSVAALLLLRLDAQPGGPGWLASLKRWFRSLAGEATVDDVAVDAASRFGAPLLTAADEEDLENRLHTVIADPDFYRLGALALRRLDLDALSSLTELKPPPQMVAVLGKTPAALVADAGRYAAAAGSAMAQLVADHRDEIIEEAENFEPWRLYADQRLPTEVKRMILDGALASASMLAIAQAHYGHTAPIDPWMSFALASRFRDGLHQYARLLASLPVHVSTDVIPMDERFDLREIELLADDREARLRAFVRHESASNDDASAP